jgi:hypothetical protein
MNRSTASEDYRRMPSRGLANICAVALEPLDALDW